MTPTSIRRIEGDLFCFLTNQVAGSGRFCGVRSEAWKMSRDTTPSRTGRFFRVEGFFLYSSCLWRRCSGFFRPPRGFRFSTNRNNYWQVGNGASTALSATWAPWRCGWFTRSLGNFSEKMALGMKSAKSCQKFCSTYIYLGGGFKDFLFSPGKWSNLIIFSYIFFFFRCWKTPSYFPFNLSIRLMLDWLSTDGRSETSMMDRLSAREWLRMPESPSMDSWFFPKWSTFSGLQKIVFFIYMLRRWWEVWRLIIFSSINPPRVGGLPFWTGIVLLDCQRRQPKRRCRVAGCARIQTWKQDEESPD